LLTRHPGAPRHSGKHPAARNQRIGSGDFHQFAARADGDRYSIERNCSIPISVRQQRRKADQKNDEQAKTHCQQTALGAVSLPWQRGLECQHRHAESLFLPLG
jgi:hypothetical protein